NGARHCSQDKGRRWGGARCSDTIEAMQISEIRLHSVAIADAPLRSSYGRHAPYALRTIVELKTTDGLTGISETYGGDRPLAALEAAKERVLGMDPFWVREVWAC